MEKNNYWQRTVQTKINGEDITVLIFLSYDDDGINTIEVRTMLNEYYLNFTIPIYDGDRDLAYSLIKHFPVAVIKETLLQQAHDNGIWE